MILIQTQTISLCVQILKEKLVLRRKCVYFLSRKLMMYCNWRSFVVSLSTAYLHMFRVMSYKRDWFYESKNEIDVFDLLMISVDSRDFGLLLYQDYNNDNTN